eukprot:1161334-Pelagomonas_calceolata.AAC.4
MGSSRKVSLAILSNELDYEVTTLAFSLDSRLLLAVGFCQGGFCSGRCSSWVLIFGVSLVVLCFGPPLRDESVGSIAAACYWQCAPVGDGSVGIQP